jgi:uncharacterized protein
VYLHGTVEVVFDTQCQRCLEPVRPSIAGDFDLVVRRGAHHEGEGDDVITLALGEYLVDIEPYVREAVVLNAPMIIVCSEQCRGLCPTCGMNLNRGSCACGPAADARWDALRKLR